MKKEQKKIFEIKFNHKMKLDGFVNFDSKRRQIY